MDETSKNEHVYVCHYGRTMSGSHALLRDVFVQGDRYSLVAAITTGSYIATTVVPGSSDSFDFYAFIAEEVVSVFLFSIHHSLPVSSMQLPQMNPYPAEHSVLILDDCHIHHNDALVDLVNSVGMCFYYTFSVI